MFGGGSEIDLDASCILLNSDYQKIDLVWFRQLKSQDGSIKHSGDNRTGDGEGDDETINVDLQRLPASVKYLIFTVNSFTGQSFEKVEKAYCRIVNGSNNTELARFNLSEKVGTPASSWRAWLAKMATGNSRRSAPPRMVVLLTT